MRWPFQREQSQFTGFVGANFQTNPSPWMDRPPNGLKEWICVSYTSWSWELLNSKFAASGSKYSKLNPNRTGGSSLVTAQHIQFENHLLGSATARHSVRFSCHPQQQKSKLPNPTDRTWQVLLRTSERYRETPEIKGSPKIWEIHLGSSWIILEPDWGSH